MKKIIFLLTTVFLIFNFFVIINPVKAQEKTGGFNLAGDQTVKKLDNPLGADMDTPQKLIGRVINSILGVVGSLALLMFVYGGLTWMTSSGSAEKVKKGRDILIWAAIGLVIVFFAYGITRVIITGVTSG